MSILFSRTLTLLARQGRAYSCINPPRWSLASEQKMAVVVKRILFKLFLGITKAFQFHVWFPQILPQWLHLHHTTHTPQPFYGPFPGTTQVSRCQKRRELLDFMVQVKINRGRHTDHPAGRHSMQTNQCPPPPSPIFLQAGCPSCHPTNSVKALKATSAFGLGRRR